MSVVTVDIAEQRLQGQLRKIAFVAGNVKPETRDGALVLGLIEDLALALSGQPFNNRTAIVASVTMGEQ